MRGALLPGAHRAGAVVIGGDRGTVLPEVRETMRKRTVLGSAVLWFTRDYADPKAPFIPPKKWPRLALASISTPHLPTVPGFLAGDHVRVRAEPGILARPADSRPAPAQARPGARPA